MNGIDCHINNDHSNTMGAEFGIGNIQLGLWVLDDRDYERARQIIEQQYRQPPVGEDWICPTCGELNAAQFGMCWNCQTEVSE